MPERKPFEGIDHSNQAFYQSDTWRRTRAAKLARNPVCELCLQQGRLTTATVVDHVIPINQGGHRLRYTNLMSLCKKCHARKSQKDGAHDDEAM
jgi:5-methylcytosine-specific restriction protein A